MNLNLKFMILKKNATKYGVFQNGKVTQKQRFIRSLMPRRFAIWVLMRTGNRL